MGYVISALMLVAVMVDDNLPRIVVLTCAAVSFFAIEALGVCSA